MYHRGFTLVELLVALVVAGILAMGAMSMGSMVRDNRRSAVINEFMAAVAYARYQALSRATPVSICRSADQSTCATDSGNWNQGWLIFTDRQTPGAVDGPGVGVTCASDDVSCRDVILKKHEALTSGFTLVGNTNVVNRITFSALGMGTNGTLTVCDSRGFGSGSRIYARQIVIGTGGRYRSVTPTTTGSCT